ncbi:MAG: dienelactone hydrolase family protein [Actinomycetota bacterium]
MIQNHWVAERLAAMGYRALVPDLYRGDVLRHPERHTLNRPASPS